MPKKLTPYQIEMRGRKTFLAKLSLPPAQVRTIDQALAVGALKGKSRSHFYAMAAQVVLNHNRQTIEEAGVPFGA